MEIIITILVAFLALNHLIYAIQNLFNLKQAHGFVEAVFTQQETPFYPRSIMPPLRSPVLTWAGLFVIIAAETTVGVMLAASAFLMAAAAGTTPANFAAAGEWALIGCGVALLLWFGLFLSIGAALFQMWQTPLGQGAMSDAYRNGVFAALVLLLLLFLPAV
ncbi:MAG: DUF2165 family protein [Xanthomonadales bacterium]|nr:DUF2165 family protein [Xanthomonadales bacterium]